MILLQQIQPGHITVLPRPEPLPSIDIPSPRPDPILPHITLPSVPAGPQKPTPVTWTTIHGQAVPLYTYEDYFSYYHTPSQIRELERQYWYHVSPPALTWEEEDILEQQQINLEHQRRMAAVEEAISQTMSGVLEKVQQKTGIFVPGTLSPSKRANLTTGISIILEYREKGIRGETKIPEVPVYRADKPTWGKPMYTGKKAIKYIKEQAAQRLKEMVYQLYPVGPEEISLYDAFLYAIGDTLKANGLKGYNQVQGKKKTVYRQGRKYIEYGLKDGPPLDPDVYDRIIAQAIPEARMNFMEGFRYSDKGYLLGPANPNQHNAEEWQEAAIKEMSRRKYTRGKETKPIITHTITHLPSITLPEEHTQIITPSTLPQIILPEKEDKIISDTIVKKSVIYILNRHGLKTMNRVFDTSKPKTIIIGGKKYESYEVIDGNPLEASFFDTIVGQATAECMLELMKSKAPYLFTIEQCRQAVINDLKSKKYTRGK